MTFLKDIQNLNKVTVLSASLLFVGLIAPGLLTIYLFLRPLFVQIESAKLVLLALAITAPGLFVPYFLSTVAANVIRTMKPEAAERFGTPLDWFALHTATNGFNFYLSLLLAYMLRLRFVTFLWIMIILLIISMIFEVCRLCKAAKGKMEPPSIMK